MEPSPPPYVLPGSARAWHRQQHATRRTLERLQGAVPPRPRPVRARSLGRRATDAYVREDLLLDDGAGAHIPAVLLLPTAGRPPWPAVLWHHSHFGDYTVGLDELFEPWPVRATPAVALTRRGYAVFAIDARAFGARQGGGPGGPAEQGRAEELALAKLFLWRGTSLWAMMLRDDRLALDYLAGRPEVDARRIAAAGMSMGSTRSWWLAALDRRIVATVAVACLTRYQDLLRARALARHGIYYFLPGMLRHFDTEAVLGLIAPRPLLTLTGGRDGGSPLAGVRALNRFCRRAWDLSGAPEGFRGVVYPRRGHVFTRDMWTAAVRFLDTHLHPAG